MARWAHRSVRVQNPELCIAGNCLCCLYTLTPIIGPGQIVECRRALCDNHLEEGEDELPPLPLRRLVTLPEPGTTVPLEPELPFAPE